MTTPIKDNCDLSFTAVHTSGTRDPKSIKWIVLHSTEGDTAAGAAEWFANPDSQGSAHLVVDDSICYRTLKNNQIPWGAPGANTSGFHIEMAGHTNPYKIGDVEHPGWTEKDWLAHDVTLRRAAFKAAFHCKAFGIPVRLITANGLRVGLKGITTHLQCSKAFFGTHTDPGENFPMQKFLVYAKNYFEGL